MKLADRLYDQQQRQYERVAHTEETAAWNNWRNEVVQLRKKQMDDVSRKRRKLDREKRLLDGPRPARRHQVFETELVRNPLFDEQQARTMPKSKAKRKQKQDVEDLDEMGAYVAYPDLRSAEDSEAWMDMERMGVQPDPRLMQSMPFYRVDEMGIDPYGMYMMDGRPPHPEMMGFGGPPAMPPMHDGAMMNRHFDGGPPPAGFLVDGFGNPAPPHMYDAQPPQGRGPQGPMDDGMMMRHPPPPMPPSQAQSHAQPPPQPARKGGRKSSPGATRSGKSSVGGVADDRQGGRKSEGGGSAAKRAAAHARTPPAAGRPGPARGAQQPPLPQPPPPPPPHHNMPPSMPHPNEMSGGRPPPPRGGAGHAPYMSPYGGGVHMGHLPPEGDGFYRAQGPPPPGMVPGPGPGPGVVYHPQPHPPPPLPSKGHADGGPPPSQQQQHGRGRPVHPGASQMGSPPYDARRGPGPGEPPYPR